MSQYLQPDGSLAASGAISVGTADIASAVATAGLAVPLQYFLGTAQHETDYVLNEVDMADQAGGSWGLFQVNTDEANLAGVTVQSCASDLMSAVLCIATNALARAAALRAAVGWAADGSQDTPDLWAWVAMAHNEGMGHAGPSAQRHNGVWSDFIATNAATSLCNGDGTGICSYGSDCIPTTTDALMNVFPIVAGAIGIQTPTLVIGLMIIAAGVGGWAYWRWKKAGALGEARVTIYEALRRKLGRDPTNAEVKADVERIREEGLIERATAGKLQHQRRRR